MSEAYEDFRRSWERLKQLDYMKVEILDDEVVTDICVLKRGDQTDTLPKELRNQLLESGRASMVCDIPPEYAKFLQAKNTGQRN